MTYSTTKKIAFSAIFVALAFLISYLEIPLFTDFLKLDFSFCIILISAFLLGPFYAEIIIICVEALCLLKGSSVIVGEVCNFILCNLFCIFPSVIYRYKKGLKVVIISLIISSLTCIILSLPINRFIIFPFYKSLGFFPVSVKEMFDATVWFLLLFNAIKYIVNALFTILLYKKVRFLLDKISFTK